MQRRTEKTRRSISPRQLGREGLSSMMRRPAVQLLLVATAAVQLVAVGSDGAERAQEAPAAVALAPMVVQPSAAEVSAAWRSRAMERESNALAAKYREQGYPLTPELAREIHEAAVEFDIDPEIAFGLVRAESSFKNEATSPVGAVGLTQLMPATARWLEPGISRRELRNPETNLRIGFRYLRDLIEKYDGDENLALVAYNRGPGTVDRALKRGRNPDNGYAAFVRGEKNHGHKLYTR